MVRLPEGYCIDSTEVTRGQYQTWLDSSPSMSQVSVCTWNTSFEPDTVCMQDEYVYQGGDSENHPMVCVDWCDAYAYCRAVGKRLCGKIGGGENGWKDYADASSSQWYNACASGAADNSYPYGQGFEETSCNVAENAAAGPTTVPVQSLLQCQSPVEGYEGVFDLSGNVAEWEDSCFDTSEYAECRRRGATFDDLDFNHGGSGDTGCRYSTGSDERDYTDFVLGFRCCS